MSFLMSSDPFRCGSILSTRPHLHRHVCPRTCRSRYRYQYTCVKADTTESAPPLPTPKWWKPYCKPTTVQSLQCTPLPITR